MHSEKIQNHDRFLTKDQVIERIPYSVVHIYRLMKRGEFPKQIRIGANRVGWLESDINEWIQSKIDEKGSCDVL
jgi:prophage regulatory protein